MHAFCHRPWLQPPLKYTSQALNKYRIGQDSRNGTVSADVVARHAVTNIDRRQGITHTLSDYAAADSYVR